MILKLYFHPLASFCHKALIALYEKEVPFEPVIVDFGDEASAAAFRVVWPWAKMPVLRDEARDRTVAESTIVVDYLEAFHPGTARLVPADPDLAWQARMWDRVFDHYVQEPMQKIVLDRLRPAGMRDAFGVEQAMRQLREAYALLERQIEGRAWMLGDAFSLADCAAAPALFYADTVVPLGPTEKNLASYLGRLAARPSFARVLREAEPYLGMFPLERKLRIPGPGGALAG
jgi:glutathione S-transferase